MTDAFGYFCSMLAVAALVLAFHLLILSIRPGYSEDLQERRQTFGALHFCAGFGWACAAYWFLATGVLA